MEGSAQRMKRVLLLLLLLPTPFAAAHMLVHHRVPPRAVLRSSLARRSAAKGGAKLRPMLARQVKVGQPRQKASLPPTAPTVLKPKAPANAVPPLPQSPAVARPQAPATVAASVAPATPRSVTTQSPQALPTPDQVRSLPAPPDAAPLRPTETAYAGGPAPLVEAQKPAVAPAPDAGTVAPAADAIPPPKVANLPPGPLTRDPAGVAATPPANELRISGLGSSSAPWGIVLLLTALTLIPSILICITPFARLLVVFHFLRQALGLQTTPSNQTLIGLTLVLTFFIMEPVGLRIYQDALVPLQNGQITAFEALSRSKEPMHDFMAHYVREKDAALFLEMAHEPRPRDIHDLSMRVLVPAYIVSELKAGFQIGAVLFLPFLVVDMVVASITTSVGMMQLPPVVISTPLKLLLFLMVDGWHLLIGSLVRSFY